jgi:branched-chain amino acid transport system permease protein
VTDSRPRPLPTALLLTALMVYPFLDRMLQAQTVHAVTDAMIYVLLALGLNIVVGYAGLLDLGYAAFFAIGAYTMGLLNSPVLGSPLYGHVWSFWVVIWIAALVSAGMGVVIGAPTLRVRGDYLAIITLAFGEIIPVAIRNLGDITIDIGGWKPIERLNLTGGENGVNPVGRPHLPFVNFDTDFIPWYFLILVIGACSLWAMNRMRDSRLGRAWMAIREDETAADCTGVNPVKTKLLAFALGASFSGFAGSFYAAKLQAITPGAFEFNVSIMLLCMVVLGGMGSLKGVILGGMLITLFDRILLAQLTFLVRWAGRSLGIASLAAVDLTLWRWFFFGLGLVVVMLIKPEGLMGRRVRAPAADVDEGEETLALVAAPPRPRADALPAWLREAAAAPSRGSTGALPRGPGGAPSLLEVRGLTRSFGGLMAVSEVDLLIPAGGIVGLIGPNGAGKTTFFNLVTGLLQPDKGDIRFDGQSLVGLKPHAIVGRGIARTFQSIRLFQNMSVLDNVRVGEHCRLHASVAGAVFRPPAVMAEEVRARGRARELLDFVSLGDKSENMAKNLAYGDQRRLEIARALATEPRLLLLDEPTAGMNPRETDALTELIGLLRRELGLAVLLIEHHMEVVMGISDRITVLDYGTRIAEGTPAEIRRNAKVIEAYLGKGYEEELVST